jgi:hypothetical protein
MTRPARLDALFRELWRAWPGGIHSRDHARLSKTAQSYHRSLVYMGRAEWVRQVTGGAVLRARMGL